MNSLKEEFQSGQFSIYGQWAGLISAVLLVVLGALCIIIVPLFSILAFVFAFVLILMEIPVFIRIMPGGPSFQPFISFFESHYLRAALYFGGSVVMFLSVLMRSSILIISAITLLGSSICYVVAGVKKQERVTSSITGGTGVIAGVQSLA